MAIKKELFGVLPNGTEIFRYVMQNKNGMTVSILNYGAIIQQLIVPDKNGTGVDVMVGFDSAYAYFLDTSAQGALVGRVVNRIKGAAFSMDGTEYLLSKNRGENHLHGGFEGFGKKIWQVKPTDGDEPAVCLTYISPDGEEGYPGTLTVNVTYTLKKSNALAIQYTATTDKKTIVNLTNHGYFNLGGTASGHVLGQVLTIDADRVLETDAALIPSGRMLAVEGKPVDFRKPKALGKDFYADDADLRQKNGYDYCFCLNEGGVDDCRVSLYNPANGILMKLYTDQPALQLYTGNFLNCKALPFKGNTPQMPQSGVCLEAQKMPDSVNHPNFTNVFIDKDEVYTQYTEYAFSVVK